ncbi:MAG: hypothetical protein ACFFE5_09710 [Candidatus Thorarchaeota archaeon]
MEKFKKLLDEKEFKLAVLGLLIIGITFGVPSLGLANTRPLEYHIQGFILCTGKIVYLSFEGGFYGIITLDGNHYDPINLPPLFEYDGIIVVFLAEITDLYSFHMWGKVIRILFII